MTYNGAFRFNCMDLAFSPVYPKSLSNHHPFCQSIETDRLKW